MAAHDPALRSRELEYRSEPDLPHGAPEFLAHLRLAALSCRTAPRTNLFEACATLSLDREKAKTASLDILVRCLSQAMAQAPTFYRPGAERLSFDEAWLVQLVASVQRADLDSFEFLLRSRVIARSRRQLAFLLYRVAERFPRS